MRALVLVVFLVAVGCGQAAPTPVGSPLTQAQLKFAVMDSVGRPVYCDPDFYPIAREGGEEQNAVNFYPQIRSDSQTYAAIIAHEHLPSGDLTDQQKLTVYRAWKLLRAVGLVPSGTGYTFEYRIQTGGSGYQMVAGTVRVDGAVTVNSRAQTTPPVCPICLAASTLIATPDGPVRVTDIHAGTVVWTQAADGSRVAEPVLEEGSMEAPAGHMVVDLALADGREVWVSPGHRTADGRSVGSIRVGDSLDGSVVARAQLVPYSGQRTYDLLPAGPTGRYWANGILLSSTLRT